MASSNATASSKSDQKIPGLACARPGLLVAAYWFRLAPIRCLLVADVDAAQHGLAEAIHAPNVAPARDVAGIQVTVATVQAQAEAEVMVMEPPGSGRGRRRQRS